MKHFLKTENWKLKISRRFVAFALVVIFMLSGVIFSFTSFLDKTPSAQAAWYDYSWQFRKKITIDHTKVSATLTDFPVLINLNSDTDLASYAQDDGDDIFFTLGDDTTKLSHQIENFNGTTGSLRAWVKIPTLSSTTDTDIYIYYGNSSATDQQNITDVWSNNYAAVWLMNEGSGTIVHDYSGNNNHGTMINMNPATDWVEYNNGYSLDFNTYTEYVDAGVLPNTFTNVTWGGGQIQMLIQNLMGLLVMLIMPAKE